MNARTTAIIVNWNGAVFIDKLLTGLTQAEVKAIIVVDNASRDDSLRIIQQHSNVHLISNGSNVGFGAAANRAIEASSTPYILLLNVDVEVMPNSVQKLEEFLDRTPDAGIVAPRLNFPDGSLQLSCRRFPKIPDLFLYLSFLDRIFPSGYRLNDQMHQHTMEVDQPMGAALMIRRLALEQTGAFDPQFFLYMEEVDLCERMKEAGWKIFYLPESQMIHIAGGSSKQNFEKSQLHYFESLIRYFRKRKTAAEVFMLRIYIALAMPVRFAVLLVRGRFQEAFFYLGMMYRIFTLK
ncbi:MAG: hypothetical protein C5B54_09960 [Acidobacteria bacterium]|nr:MAG: hypothetical protein C5B54_09960 [Acidobacteriota bacterium]